jgi:uncharacterized membrane protein (UPF0127 family)
VQSVQAHKPLSVEKEMKPKICATTLSHMRGLMFSRKRKCILAFSKEQIIPLHTWFVFFPIKITFLNSKKRVVERTVMQPFTTYTPKIKARYVVETPI